MSADIVLTWPELMFAAHAAIIRQIQNLRLGRRDKYGCKPDDGWTPHIEGAAAELAVAKLTGSFWSGAIGNLKADDVGLLQVRSSTRADARLILHDDDPDDRAFVLVTGKAPSYKVHGWILGRAGKRPEWWADPSGKGRPAYFVPASALTPFTLSPSVSMVAAE